MELEERSLAATAGRLWNVCPLRIVCFVQQGLNLRQRKYIKFPSTVLPSLSATNIRNVGIRLGRRARKEGAA